MDEDVIVDDQIGVTKLDTNVLFSNNGYFGINIFY